MNRSQKESRVNHTDRKLLHIEEVFPDLIDQHTQLYEELNNIEPPISILPPEILCAIFVFARPSGFDHKDYRETELFCSLEFVSKRWRGVLLSNPVIWTNVDICLPFSPAARIKANPLFQFIKYSGRLPLSLGIRYPLDFLADNTTLIHPSVDGFFLENLRRITHLRLEYAPPAWASHFHLLKQLTHFQLSCCSNAFPPFPFDQLDSLSEFTLISSSRIRLVSTLPITTLKLLYIPIDTSFEILCKCPNLRNLHWSCRDHSGLPTDPPVDTFTLPHLEHLHWETNRAYSERWYIAILTHIRLPSLRTLEWEWLKKTELSTLGPAVTGFFARLPTTLASLTLRHLRIVFGEYMEPIIPDIYEILPGRYYLESVEFVECTIRYLTGFLGIIQSPGHFPQLRTVKMNGLCLWESYEYSKPRWPFDEVKQELACACLSMLRDRMQWSNKELIFEVIERVRKDQTGGSVSKNILERLDQLRESGCVKSTYVRRNSGNHGEHHELVVCCNSDYTLD